MCQDNDIIHLRSHNTSTPLPACATTPCCVSTRTLLSSITVSTPTTPNWGPSVSLDYPEQDKRAIELLSVVRFRRAESHHALVTDIRYLPNTQLTTPPTRQSPVIATASRHARTYKHCDQPLGIDDSGHSQTGASRWLLSSYLYTPSPSPSWVTARERKRSPPREAILGGRAPRVPPRPQHREPPARRKSDQQAACTARGTTGEAHPS